MPPKKQITREDILQGAMTLFRERGMDAIGARELAHALGCSTQPIYLSFSGMDALKEALHEQMWVLYGAFLEHEMSRTDMPPYKASGMGYIRFAREEPAIFRYLFMRPRDAKEQAEDGTEHFSNIVDIVQRQLGLSREAATRFHMEQWIFVHGIASMLATSYLDLDEESISGMLTELYLALKARYLSEQEKEEK